MATIDIKLKSYEELQFEITRMTTDIYLKDLHIKELQDRIDSVIHDLEYIIDYFKEHKNELPKQSDYIKDAINILKNGF